MAENIKRKTPFCPMLSSGGKDLRICLKDDCAWYMPSTKTCAMYVIGHSNVLKIKAKQGK